MAFEGVIRTLASDDAKMRGKGKLTEADIKDNDA